MKSLNDIILDKRKEAILLSKKAMQNNQVFQTPLEVKIKRSKLGASCGLVIIFISVLLNIVTSSHLAIGMCFIGLLTSITNLVMLKYFSK